MITHLTILRIRTDLSLLRLLQMFFCFLNLGKLPLRVMGGTLGMPMVPLASGLGAVAVVGVFLAKPIMLGMNEKTFVRLELGVVAFAGLRLCYMGLVK